jgi:hypothetical protein
MITGLLNVHPEDSMKVLALSKDQKGTSHCFAEFFDKIRG